MSMKKIFKETATAHSGTVHGFSQGDLLKKLSDNPDAGVCQGLTMLDGMMKAQGESYNKAGLQTMAGYAKMISPKFNGKVAKFDIGCIKNKYLELMGEFQTNVRIGYVEAMSANKVVDFIKNKKGYFNLNFPLHTTGAGRCGDKITYFEPNGGSVRFPTMDKQETFMNAYHSNADVKAAMGVHAAYDVIVVQFVKAA